MIVGILTEVVRNFLFHNVAHLVLISKRTITLRTENHFLISHCCRLVSLEVLLAEV